MKILIAARLVLLGIICSASVMSNSAAHAEIIGKWTYQSTKNQCLLGTALGAGKLLMLTNGDGSSLLLLSPIDQSLVTVGQKYKIQLIIGGEQPVELTTDAVQVEGAKALAIGIRATAFADRAHDGVALRIRMGDKELFDMDKAGSSEAFAAYVACSKKLNAKF